MEVTLFSEDVALLNMLLLLIVFGGLVLVLVADVSELERCSRLCTKPL